MGQRLKKKTKNYYVYDMLENETSKEFFDLRIRSPFPFQHLVEFAQNTETIFHCYGLRMPRKGGNCKGCLLKIVGSRNIG